MVLRRHSLSLRRGNLESAPRGRSSARSALMSFLSLVNHPSQIATVICNHRIAHCVPLEKASVIHPLVRENLSRNVLHTSAKVFAIGIEVTIILSAVGIHHGIAASPSIA